MEGSECHKKPLYCHWDSHEQDVLFMNENELDQHIYSHISHFPDSSNQHLIAPATAKAEEVRIKAEQDEKLQQTVECHWDACHELFDIDEIMEHFRSSHMDVSQHPHDANCMREIKHCNTDANRDVNQVTPMPTNNKLSCVSGYDTYHQVPDHLSPASMASIASSHISQDSDYSTVSSHQGPPDSRRNSELGQNNNMYTASVGSGNSSSQASSGAYAAVSTAPSSQPSPSQYGPSDVKIDINSLPTLPSQRMTGEVQGMDLTCMWLTPDGVCGQQFYTSNELNAHIVHHHLDPQCQTCMWDGCRRENIPFTQRQKIIRHIQVHARTTDHMCHVCDKTMSSDALLKAHELRHLNEWPFKCDICQKSFRTKNSLNVHIRTHTGAKPLVCSFPGCGKRFAESSNLAKHRRTHMAPQFMCPVCSRMFTRKDHLRRHMRTKDHFDPAGSESQENSMGTTGNNVNNASGQVNSVVVVPPTSIN